MDNFNKQYLKNGYGKVSFSKINQLQQIVTKHLEVEDINNLHSKVEKSKINDVRLKLIELFSTTAVKDLIYSSLQKEIDSLVGSEIAIQKNINLNIQVPDCDQSLLPFHSDVLCGNSPYEVVVWIPLVDVYDTKTMYIFDLETSKLIKEEISNNTPRVDLERKYQDKKVFMNLDEGEALIFSPFLIHGNQVNESSETRVSLNLRFKNYFSPYKDKLLLSYFEAYRIGTQTRLALNYEAEYEI